MATVSPGGAHERFLATRYFPALDGLRAIAVSAVVFHHSTSRPLPGFLGRGHLGVQLFFCISGFLITTLLLREQRESGTVSLRRFWIRRSLRIFPLYYAVLGLFALFMAGAHDGPSRTHFFGNLPFFLSYTGNWWVDYGVPHAVVFGFAWSLATEEQFYALWPPLLKASKRVWPALLVLSCLLTVDQLAERGGLGFALTRHGPLERIVTSFSSSIALGALFALLLDGPRGRWLSQWFGHPAALPGCALLALALVVRPVEPFLCFEFSLAALVAASALSARGVAYRLLACAPLVQVGRASYGMYLFHVPVIGVLRLIFPEFSGFSLALFAVAHLLTFGLASSSQRWFEQPFLRLRARFGAGELASPALSGATRQSVVVGVSAAAGGIAEEPAPVLELNRARID
jgi:peptidoglycan/LPS O-acetylase OafA/YrhL